MDSSPTPGSSPTLSPLLHWPAAPGITKLADAPMHREMIYCMEWLHDLLIPVAAFDSAHSGQFQGSGSLISGPCSAKCLLAGPHMWVLIRRQKKVLLWQWGAEATAVWDGEVPSPCSSLRVSPYLWVAALGDFVKCLLPVLREGASIFRDINITIFTGIPDFQAFKC